jgi:FixJ family two-component response regulator
VRSVARTVIGSGGVRAIAILEDDADLRTLFAELFESSLGVQAITARSVAQLVDQAPAVLHTQLALIDVNLGPDVPDGFDAYDWLREHQYAGRVVFLTGHAESDPLMQRARTVSNVQVLHKPVTAEVLLEVASGGGTNAQRAP